MRFSPEDTDSLCQPQNWQKSLTEVLWRRNIFLGQAHLQILQTKNGMPVDREKLHEHTRSLASKMQHDGFAAGICPKANQRAWTLTAPAGQRPHIHILGLTLPMDYLKQRCRKVEALFAPDKKGQARPLADVGSPLHLGEFQPGFIGVYCTPQKPTWLGPQLFYLIPTRDKNLPQPPHWPKNLHGQSALFEWINRIRTDLHLSRVTHLSDLEAAAFKLLKNTTLNHDRRQLISVGVDLHQKNIELLGENRVRGLQVLEMAQLLWTSPGHRNLLLHDQAKFLGIAFTHSQESGALAVILLGAARPQTERKLRSQLESH